MYPDLRITQSTPRRAVIDIEGTIGADLETVPAPQAPVSTYRRFREKLDRLAALRASEVVVNIRSTGGSLADALLIYETLCSLEARVVTRCWGYTASAATVIAQAASPRCREISANCLYLVHCSESAAEGNRTDLERSLDLLRQTDRRVAELYAARSQRPAEEFLSLMARGGGRGCWLSPQEALRAGLADRIIRADTDTSVPQAASGGLPESPPPVRPGFRTIPSVAGEVHADASPHSETVDEQADASRSSAAQCGSGCVLPQSGSDACPADASPRSAAQDSFIHTPPEPATGQVPADASPQSETVEEQADASLQSGTGMAADMPELPNEISNKLKTVEGNEPETAPAESLPPLPQVSTFRRHAANLTAAFRHRLAACMRMPLRYTPVQPTVLQPQDGSPVTALPPRYDSPLTALHPEHDSLASAVPPQDDSPVTVMQPQDDPPVCRVQANGDTPAPDPVSVAADAPGRVAADASDAAMLAAREAARATSTRPKEDPSPADQPRATPNEDAYRTDAGRMRHAV